MEKELIEKRDRLQFVKTERDKLRLDANRMKQNSSYVSKPALLEDVSVRPLFSILLQLYERRLGMPQPASWLGADPHDVQKDKKDELLQKLAEVKAMHHATTEKVSLTTQKILQMTEYANTPGSGMDPASLAIQLVLSL
eukprot:scaffold114953_cov36-Prasinocladus_malaysianus.AAC.1